ncbi:hypothetical protein [Acidovorax sp. SUPP2825]|uniref:hypothetical protein n=1 Tax=Acidovorax sp. SUPP2825 TaxID=2920879 RepID=UPI0023DE1F73|nr:hypothetical protein [Acidovorax sp. SUPP2825]GKS95077.1 hypothetical protein AVAK2825_11100 [Acidovorax sp. SUPP2825]
MSRISGISSPLRPAPGIVVDPSPGLLTPVAPVRRRRQPPSAEPTLPELARRLSSAPMPPRAPLHVVRHSLLPPQFQSPQRPGTEPPETYQRHSKLPPQYQSPLRQSFLPPQAYQSHSAMNTFQSPYAPAPQGAFGSSVLPPAPAPQDPARPEAAAQRPPRVSVLPQVRPSILQGASPRPQGPRPSVLPQRPSFQSSGSGSSAASGSASAQAPMETRYSVLPAKLQAASAAFQSVAHAAVAIGLESANTVQITTAAQAQEVLARVQRLATQAAPALHALSGALQHMVENKTRLSQEIREELADIGQSLLTTGQSLQKFLNHTLGRFAPQTMPPAEPPAETPADAAAAAETAAVAETTAKAEAEAAAAPPPPPPPPKAHLKPRPQKHPAAKPALHPVPAAPAPTAKPVPVHVMAISTEEGRAALRAGFGTPESADAGLREIALAFKAAQNGSTDDKRAFQLAYQDRLTLPDDFSSGNVAAVKQLKRLLAGVNVAYVSPQYGKDMGVGSDDFNARRSAAAAA